MARGVFRGVTGVGFNRRTQFGKTTTDPDVENGEAGSPAFVKPKPKSPSGGQAKKLK